MKLSILLCFCLLAQGVLPHMPTVYEFCSHVVANGQSGQATCDASQCQGRPGNIGPKGIQGLKGQKGETQTSETVEEKVRILEESLKQIDAMMMSTPMKEAMCYMGMKSGKIPDSAITSSSDWDENHSAHLGRLDNQPSGSKWGTWIVGISQVGGGWIQVDLGQPEVVAGVVTQGHPPNYCWVASYKVSCGNVVNSMTTITEHGQDKVFSANTDKESKVVNKFPQLLTCRYIRIYPQTYHNHICLRLEIFRGICKDIY